MSEDNVIDSYVTGGVCMGYRTGWAKMARKATKVAMKLNTASLEDWYPKMPAEIFRRCSIVERYEFDGVSRLRVKIEEGPEAGRVVSGLSPSNVRGYAAL